MSILLLLAVAATLTNTVLGRHFVSSSNYTAHLTLRWDPSTTADDELWSNSVCRGEQFVGAFPGTDEAAGKIFKFTANPPTMQSQWQGDLKNELATWGWDEVNADDESMCDFANFWKYDTSFDALRLNKKPKYVGFPKVLAKDGGDNICYEIRHGDDNLNNDHEAPFVHQLYKVGNEEYSKTGAYHKVAINLVGGVVMAQFRVSPQHAATMYWDHEPHKSELPALRSSADLLWGLWFRDNPNIKNLRYFWSQGIINPESNLLIASALKIRGKELTGWPGATFSMEDDEGMALLGSPNAVSFGYFLVSHKRELGNKKITKVQVFFGNENSKASMTERHPEMLFYVEDA